jgi:hypothetical protein
MAAANDIEEKDFFRYDLWDLATVPFPFVIRKMDERGSVVALQVQRKLTHPLGEWISEGNGGCYPSELSHHLLKMVGRISMRESAVLSTVWCIYYNNVYRTLLYRALRGR